MCRLRPLEINRQTQDHRVRIFKRRKVTARGIKFRAVFICHGPLKPFMLRAMMIVQKYHHFLRWLGARTPRQDMLVCLVLGGLNALAMPPVYLFPVLLVTFPVFIRLLDKSFKTIHAFLKAFLFFFAFHVAGLYWIAAALFIDIAHNWWVLPFALSGLPAALALYPAIAVMVWQRLAWQGSARLLSLIVLLSISDWVRGWLFTGFPWNLWGYAWVAYGPVMQSVALFGVYGLSCATLIFACLPVFFTRNYKDRFSKSFCAIFGMVAIIMLAWGFGRANTPLPIAENAYLVRIVQPNIVQDMKWDPDTRLAHELKLWGLTIANTSVSPDIIVWPETAISLYSTSDVRRLDSALHEFMPPQAILATGVLEMENDPATGRDLYYNRLSFYNAAGQRMGRYDKTHLVPFGEFLPFQEYWPVRPIAFANGSMSRGIGLQTLTMTGIPALSPLICYEVLFPGAAALDTPRPAWILNVTNDAWYGNTSGPYQHLAIARTRAIEEGLPVVRSANTGISAMIDPMGRIVEYLPLNTGGVIDQPLPASLKPTLFSRFGNKLLFVILGLLWLVAWRFQRRRVVTLDHVH